MAMAYRTSYRWWVLAIRASRKKTIVTRKIEKWMATFCLVDLFSTVHKWNCSTSTLQLGVPFISVLRTLQNANSHFVLTHQHYHCHIPEKRITNVPFRIAIGRRLLFTEWCFVTMPVATQRNIISPSKPFSPFAENVGSGYSFRANHSVVEPSTFSTLYRKFKQSADSNLWPNNVPILSHWFVNNLQRCWKCPAFKCWFVLFFFHPLCTIALPGVDVFFVVDYYQMIVLIEWQCSIIFFHTIERNWWFF